jgi:hypothetical protein
MVAGDIVGTWRRSGVTVTISSWIRPSRADRDAVEAEVSSLPIPDATSTFSVRWTRPSGRN